MCDEKKTVRKIILGFSAGGFFLSLITLVLAVMIAVKLGAVPFGPNADFLISKKYDKGQSIEKALKTEKPVVVWFYTDWCGYCKKFAPTYAKLSKDRAVKKDFAIAYVNCDAPDNRKYMEEYAIQGFPTMYIVKGEKKKHISNDKLFSSKALQDLKEELEDFLDDTTEEQKEQP